MCLREVFIQEKSPLKLLFGVRDTKQGGEEITFRAYSRANVEG
jgi:hypothetical protein